MELRNIKQCWIADDQMPETNHMNLFCIREVVVGTVTSDLYVTVVVYKIHIPGAIEYMLTHICRSIGGLL